MLIRLVNCKESLLSGTHGAPINGRALYMDNSDYNPTLWGYFTPYIWITGVISPDFMGFSYHPMFFGAHLGIQKPQHLRKKTHAEETPMQPLQFANFFRGDWWGIFGTMKTKDLPSIALLRAY